MTGRSTPTLGGYPTHAKRDKIHLILWSEFPMAGDWHQWSADIRRREDEVRQALENARAEFEEAKRAFDDLTKTAHDMRSVPHPDGTFARRRALERYNIALGQYRTALKEFADKVLSQYPKPL
jgi:hypothetical protein